MSSSTTQQMFAHQDAKTVDVLYPQPAASGKQDWRNYSVWANGFVQIISSKDNDDASTATTPAAAASATTTTAAPATAPATAT